MRDTSVILWQVPKVNDGPMCEISSNLVTLIDSQKKGYEQDPML
jgi:hypothetical protein